MKDINNGQLCLPRYLRTVLCLQVEGIPRHAVLGSLHATLHKLIVNVGLDVGPRTGTATLALVEEQGEVGLLYSFLHFWEKGEGGARR